MWFAKPKLNTQKSILVANGWWLNRRSSLYPNASNRKITIENAIRKIK